MKPSSAKNIFIGLAWPYANGSLHLGHVSAFMGADIIARYYRLKGDNVLFVSGSDCYGTPIAVEADERGISPAEIADKYHAEFKETLINGMGFSCDIYTRTTTEHHARVVQGLFLELHKKGFLYTKKEKALYSPFLKRFLPDRFVEGTCPKCGFGEARGDQCDQCGSLLDPLELKNPRINPKILTHRGKLTDADVQLETRQSEQFYLKLSALERDLENFVSTKSDLWRVNASSFAKGFLKQGLNDRAITRDTDWGVPIPIAGYEDKKIYVWFEALTGYLSASKLWAEEKGQSEEWKDFWHNDEAIHYYVHGKDNIPFHTIIWPAILLAEGKLHTPDRIISSEYLNLEGKQFSKSRAWAVWLPDFLANFEAETLRYFLVMNGPESSDANFVWSEYSNLVNGELIGTFGNLVNRVLTFGKDKFPDGLNFPTALNKESKELLLLAGETFSSAGRLIEDGKFRAAFRAVLNIAENGNRFVNKSEPWHKIKDETKKGEVEDELAVMVHLIRVLAVLINPFLPRTSEKIHGFLGLGTKELKWAYPEPNKLQKIISASPLFKKIEDEQIDKQLSRLKDALRSHT
ncbi:MAG: methionine--tRNA ligase [Patescibacteria group bacterium]